MMIRKRKMMWKIWWWLKIWRTAPSLLEREVEGEAE